MTTLMSTDDTRYTKRMVRELNRHGLNGFYANTQRANAARLQNGKLQVRLLLGRWSDANSNTKFTTTSGKEIVASREV